jgi:hypothetical protein
MHPFEYGIRFATYGSSLFGNWIRRRIQALLIRIPSGSRFVGHSIKVFMTRFENFSDEKIFFGIGDTLKDVKTPRRSLQTFKALQIGIK